MNNSEAGGDRRNYIVTYSLPNSPIWRHAIVLADSERAAQKALEREWEGRAASLAVVMHVEVMRESVYLVD